MCCFCAFCLAPCMPTMCLGPVALQSRLRAQGHLFTTRPSCLYEMPEGRREGGHFRQSSKGRHKSKKNTDRHHHVSQNAAINAYRILAHAGVMHREDVYDTPRHLSCHKGETWRDINTLPRLSPKTCVLWDTPATHIPATELQNICVLMSNNSLCEQHGCRCMTECCWVSHYSYFWWDKLSTLEYKTWS